MSQSSGGPVLVNSGGADLPINPLFVPALAPDYTLINGTINGILSILLIVGAFVSLIVRYRAAQMHERQQIKWFVWTTGVAFALIIFSIAIAQPGNTTPESPLDVAIASLFAIVPSAAPALGIGLAILRNRLWEIDFIINRTLVYGSLTVLLALLYFGLIFLLQALLQGMFLQNNEVAIVVSTLAIAALFQPLRGRIQKIIDRRFYRRKYDAVRTLAEFSAALRDEVDLTELRKHLLAVVEDTMQPARISLWLRPANQETKRSTPS